MDYPNNLTFSILLAEKTFQGSRFQVGEERAHVWAPQVKLR